MTRASFYTVEKIGPRQELTGEGFLVCYDVPLARTGVMIYGPDETPLEPGPEGIVKIYRDEEEVFRPETIASALGKSVTNDHPDDDVTPDVWKELSHGVILNVRRGEGGDDDLLLADLLITTTEGIEAVQSGKREVSLGYDADYIQIEPGVGKQSNIIINHVAFVEQGRCGPRCAIKDHKTNVKKEAVEMRRNKVSDQLMGLLRRAYKAKDSDEFEKIEEEFNDASNPDKEEMHDSEIEPDSDDVHIHIDGQEDGEEAEGEGSVQFGDDDYQDFRAGNEADHAEFRARLDRIEAMLNGSGEEQESFDEEYKTESNNAMEEAMMDEIPEELQEQASKTGDSRYLGDSFRETVSMAEILSPGIKFPTFDSGARPLQTFKKICGLRRKALDGAYADRETRAMMEDVLAGKTFDQKRMTCDAVRVLFRSAYAAKRRSNNSFKTGDRFTQPAQKTGLKTIAELNKLNSERYSKS